DRSGTDRRVPVLRSPQSTEPDLPGHGMEGGATGSAESLGPERRVQLGEAGWAKTVGEVRLRVAWDIGLGLDPVAVVATDFLARGTDREQAAQYFEPGERGLQLPFPRRLLQPSLSHVGERDDGTVRRFALASDKWLRIDLEPLDRPVPLVPPSHN